MTYRGVRLFLVPVLLLCLAIAVSAQRPAGDTRQAVAPAPEKPAATGQNTTPAPDASGFDNLVTPFLSENCYQIGRAHV